MRFPRLIALLTAIAFAAAGCSARSGSTPTGSQTASPPGAARSASPGPAPNEALAAAVASPSPAKTLPPQNRPCTPVRYASSTSGVPGGTHFIAEISHRSTWGPRCKLFDPGDLCEIGWSGAYSAPGEKAYLEFQAWLPKTKKPAVSKLIGPVPAGDGNFDRQQFLFRVPNVKAVLFRMVLRNDAKVELADTDSYVFWVGCISRGQRQG